ncbi:MAG: translation repressor RelE [bacterium]|nr:MAG: translation repressor RelE [bacterium]
MYRVETTPDFDRDIKRLDREIALRIIKKLDWLSQHPEVLKFPLKNSPKDIKGIQKYRVGDYRILLWVDHKKQVITLYGVEHRRSVYKDL